MKTTIKLLPLLFLLTLPFRNNANAQSVYGWEALNNALKNFIKFGDTTNAHKGYVTSVNGKVGAITFSIPGQSNAESTWVKKSNNRIVQFDTTKPVIIGSQAPLTNAGLPFEIRKNTLFHNVDNSLPPPILRWQGTSAGNDFFQMAMTNSNLFTFGVGGSGKSYEFLPPVGIAVPAINQLDVAGNAAFGQYAGINAAPLGGVIASGRGGFGTSGPTAQLSVVQVNVGVPSFDINAGATSFADSGYMTAYNNIPLVRPGIPLIVASYDASSSSASIPSTIIYSIPGNASGIYSVSWNATIMRASSTSSVLGGTNGFQITYVDPDGSITKTTIPALTQTSTANTTATATSSVLIADCKDGTNLKFSFDYTSVGATTMQYDLHVTVMFIRKK